MEEIFINGEYNRVAEAISCPKMVLDLGVNIGMSVHFWQIKWPDAFIVGVEPDADNLCMAKQNIIPAQSSRAMLIQACVAGETRRVHLDRCKGEYAYTMVNGTTADESLEAMTVPQICQRAALNSKIDLLKCDIEGAEMEVFANCAPWIGQVKNMIVELHAPYTLQKFRSDLLNAGANPTQFDVESKGSFAVVFVAL